MAPTVLRDGQFRLFFFSREETRIHVHVSHPDGEAKFWLTPEIHLAIAVGLNPRSSHRRNHKCLAQSFRLLRLPTFQSMGSGFCSATKNCCFLSSIFHGFVEPPSSKYPMWNGQHLNISTGPSWT
jgi:hypothetical protein